jgi:hypothetical protein
VPCAEHGRNIAKRQEPLEKKSERLFASDLIVTSETALLRNGSHPSKDGYGQCACAEKNVDDGKCHSSE